MTGRSSFLVIYSLTLGSNDLFGYHMNSSFFLLSQRAYLKIVHEQVCPESLESDIVHIPNVLCGHEI